MGDLETSARRRLTDSSGDEVVLQYPGFGKIALIWTAIGLLTAVRYQFQPHATSTDIGELAFTLAFTALYYPWIALTPLVFRVEKRFPLGIGNWPRHLGTLAVVSVPICLLASPLMSGFFVAVSSALASGAVSGVHFKWFAHFPMAQILFWSSVAGGYFVRTQFEMRQQDQRAARLALEKSQLEAGLKQAQLDVLRARLNPHFLFNSLQNISVMTKQDPTVASRMLTRLGDLLRAVLRQDSGPESTLDEEIELTRSYVALEQMRFGDRLDVSFDVVPEARDAMVPCFLLQPLIENAVVHGLRGVRKTGVIAVSANVAAGELVLTVTDNGIGPPQQDMAGLKMGIGLSATRERLATMYPDDHTFTIRPLPEGGTEVRIVIPSRFPDGGGPRSSNEHPAAISR